MKIIDTYSASWNTAKPLRVGSLVAISDSPDAREIDDFRRCMRKVGRKLSWQHRMPRKRVDVYKVVNGDPDDAFLCP
jgi:hypothetical protein